MAQILAIRAVQLLRENIGALLAERRLKQKDLASWCGHSEAWISAFLREEREIPVKELDRIADFFALATYQLFQPGISRSTERRHAQRRVGRDRRVSQDRRIMRQTAAELDRVRHATETPIPADGSLHRLIAQFVRDAGPILHADAGRQTPVARPPQSAARALRRATGRPDDPERQGPPVKP